MPNRPTISQILIPNTKRSIDYVSIYQEKIGTGEPVELFLIVEIKGEKKSKTGVKHSQFDELTAAVARSLKQTYLTESKINENTFEKALANVNSELSELVRRGITGWYRRLNALIAVYYRDNIYVSVTGSASAFLLRENEFTHISESLSTGNRPHPIKTFLNFASGRLLQDDTVLLSTAGLYNYSSLEKLRKTFSSMSLSDATRAVIADLKTDAAAQEAFASLIFKISPQLALSHEEIVPLMAATSHTIIEDEQPEKTTGQETPTTTRDWPGMIKRGGHVVWQGLRALGRGFVWLYGVAYGLRQKKPSAAKNSEYSFLNQRKTSRKKILFAVFVVVAFLLVASVIFANFRNSTSETQNEIQALLEQTRLKVTDAEGALIYGDEGSALASLQAAQQDLRTVTASGFFPSESAEVEQKINNLFAQLSKVRTVNAQFIAQFTISPNTLISYPGGFLGFNSFTDSFERFTNGQSQPSPLTPANEIGADLGAADSAGNLIILTTDTGGLVQLDLDAPDLVFVSATSTSAGGQPPDLSGLAMYVSRVYAIDQANSQIIRYTGSGASLGTASAWLSSGFDLSDARDLTVDGDIYVLTGSTVHKFSQGSPVEFTMPQLATPLQNASKISTQTDSDLLYILDPDNRRVVAITKQGLLSAQYTSEQFTDLRDFWVDEAAGAVFLLNGGDLLRIAL